MIINCVSWFTILASIVASALIIAWGLASRTSRRRKWFLSAGLFLAFFALVITVLKAGLVFIEPDERGVVITAVEGGVRPEPLQPGLNWTIPYLETVITYPITRQPYAMTVVPKVGSHFEDDLIQVETAGGDKRYIGAFVLYSIDPDRVIEVHIRWQNRYEENLVKPVVRGVIRDVIRQYYDTAEIDSDNIMLIEGQIQAEAALSLQEGGILLLELTLTEVLDEQEYSALLEQRRSEEPEAEDTTDDRESSLVGVQSLLQTVACFAFPLMVIIAVVLSARRKAVVSEPSDVAVKGQVSDAVHAIGVETLRASSPEDYYLLGKALLERGERSQAIEAFTEAYRTSDDPILKREALKQLEGLDAVKRL